MAINLGGMQHMEIQAWLGVMMNPKTELSLEDINERDFILQTAIIIDSIWFSKNQAIHQEVRHRLMEMIRGMRSQMYEHQAAWREQNKEDMHSWKPPSEGQCKL